MASTPAMNTPVATATTTSESVTVLDCPSLSPSGSAEEFERSVRFDNQCVLIPEPEPRQRMPRVVTKSYSLPIWRRRKSSPSASSPGTAEQDAPLAGEDGQVFIRLPIPSFVTHKSPQSSTRSSEQPPPLSPCLVNRLPSSPTPLPFALTIQLPQSPRPSNSRRTPSLSPTSPRADLVTIPLRPCCKACMPITEACLQQGDDWHEHFSRSARRRRTIDSTPRRASGVGKSTKSGPDTTDLASDSLRVGFPDSINVDEVDKRRRLSDSVETQPEPKSVWLNDDGDWVPLSQCKTQIQSRTALDSRRSASADSPNSILPQSVPLISKIQEEDDGDLFPLPSPRRTPNGSPIPSPVPSFLPSPVVSTSCLALNDTNLAASSLLDSDDSCATTESSGDHDESLKVAEANTDVFCRPPSPLLLGSLPSLSARKQAKPVQQALPALSTSFDDPHSPTFSEAFPRTPSPVIQFSSGSPALPVYLSPPTSPGTSHVLSSSPPSESPLPDFSPSLSPTQSFPSPTTKKRASFSMPRPSHILRVGADVLRGVGAIGGGSVGVGVRV